MHLAMHLKGQLNIRSVMHHACMIEIQKAPSDKERTDKRIKGNQDYQCAKNIQRIISAMLFWWI